MKMCFKFRVNHLQMIVIREIFLQNSSQVGNGRKYEVMILEWVSKIL